MVALGVLLIMAVCLPGRVAASALGIEVVYPKPDQVMGAVDSSFIFGHLTGEFDYRHAHLEINGQPVEVHRGGGFLAFVEVTPGEFKFGLNLYGSRQIRIGSRQFERHQLLTNTVVYVRVPEPLTPVPDDTLMIAGDYRPPSGDLVLAAGERLEVSFRGTPGLTGWFAIEGVIDSVPMFETAARQQPYWGDAVFGVGAVPDSLLVAGIYSGFYIVPESVSVLNAPVIYHLAAPPKKYLRPNSVAWPLPYVNAFLLEFLLMETEAKAVSSYRVSLNHPEYPVTVRFIDSAQIIRHGPRLGYFSIFQPEGIEALAIGRQGDWYRLQLSHTQYAWANAASVERLPHGLLPPHSRLGSVRTYSAEDNLKIEFPLSGQHPFRIYEDDRRTLRVQLFGVTTNTDWIRYDFSDPLVEIATWSQPEDDLYELRLKLTADIWGYDTYYEGNRFFVQLNKAPEHVGRLRGKTIVVDPGHSADAGAVGPTGLTEAEANLGIALELRRALERGGATVIMTRSDMTDLPLYDRPAIAKANDADLFVSIHNNALPDGVNPFSNYGVSTYYYHPHSIELARAIQKEMLRATKMPDFGLYHGNLAVNRPTQYPAVLVECAFMMIPEQEALLKTTKYRRKVARAIKKGIEEFLENYNRD